MLASTQRQVDYLACNGCTRERVTTLAIMTRAVGELLRQWRRARGLSQLEFANRAGVSTRHVSFVETGRTAPSRDMVLRLAEHLSVPLRERNRLLIAAGYAPVYLERSWDGPEMTAARHAVRQILDGHHPYPALAVDGRWNLVLANSAMTVFLDGVDASLLEPPVNMMRLSMHPGGFASRVTNMPEVRARLLFRLAGQVRQSGDPFLTSLHREVISYGTSEAVVRPGADDIAMPIRIRHGGQELSFINMIARFGTAFDVTLDEIAVESYFPADSSTADALNQKQ
ncbi:Helix-turn-helix domain-containing protein [Actinoplanes regularis]|uniref:Helix-turn-helix domain-containing protein n=2 Tax=Actinoplanes regularis TaxID=52697 RepID=A0A239C3Q4_9ACTN|nr:transcriptional regulator [Actinoplanes regularis]SNS14887.1 Helix-turn-helix domain-containing protein [Actinoplanes regularis]